MTVLRLDRSMTYTVNLGNSIIGVSILAMPLCFKQCGIALAIFTLAASVALNRFSCYLLLKLALDNRRRSYELLAFDAFGGAGRTAIEIGILLYLLGTCVAFFVIVGDIAPALVAQLFAIDDGPHLRALIVTALAMFVIFPLGLLRDIDALTSCSMISLGVYMFLALRMIALAADKIYGNSAPLIPKSADSIPIRWSGLTWWNSAYLISYLPIFAMALSCQSQMFEIFQSELVAGGAADNNRARSLRRMMQSTTRAIYSTAIVYCAIGFFGYAAFHDHVTLSGNVLQALPAGLATKITLTLFLLTLLMSFPLCLFPCRSSLHSLLFRRSTTTTGVSYDLLSTSSSFSSNSNIPASVAMTAGTSAAAGLHISDGHFRFLTMLLIVSTMGVSIIFPHVELVLALIGSTIGAIICYITPAIIFIKRSDKNTIEYLLAYLLALFGVVILVFCTFSALHNIYAARDVEIEEKIIDAIQQAEGAGVALPANDKIINKNKNNHDLPLPATRAPPAIIVARKNSSSSATSTADVRRKSKSNQSEALLENAIERKNAKLRESIANDLRKMRKQEELLHRLEKQQQEHARMLQEQRAIIAQIEKKTETSSKSGAADKRTRVDTINLNSSHAVDKAPAPPAPAPPPPPPSIAAAAPSINPIIADKMKKRENGAKMDSKNPISVNDNKYVTRSHQLRLSSSPPPPMQDDSANEKKKTKLFATKKIPANSIDSASKFGNVPILPLPPHFSSSSSSSNATSA